MPFNRSYILSALFVGIILIGSSCSTEKDAPLNVGYHNMTARYNGYFNARMLMQEALEGYRESAKEDYTKILPLDLYPSQEEVTSIQEQYETALEKCEKVIFRHSMPSSATRNKNEENCRWIDDNWFVIGMIHYTRREYVKAEEIFNQMTRSSARKDAELAAYNEDINLYKDDVNKRIGRFPLQYQCSSRHEDMQVSIVGDAQQGMVMQVELLCVTKHLYQGGKAL